MAADADMVVGADIDIGAGRQAGTAVFGASGIGAWGIGRQTVRRAEVGESGRQHPARRLCDQSRFGGRAHAVS
jgi:hypothetical protein